MTEKTGSPSGRLYWKTCKRSWREEDKLVAFNLKIVRDASVQVGHVLLLVYIMFARLVHFFGPLYALSW
jgi:hypothetical protein